MTNQHLITPPPELVDKWHDQWLNVWGSARNIRANQWIANQSAQWGADQELEACCDVMRVNGDYVSGGVLRAIRRPQPPSLKEQALKGFDDISQFALGELEGTSDYEEYKKIADTVLEALESL